VEGAPTSFVKQRERLRALKAAQELYSSIVAKERLRLARDLRDPFTEDLAEDDLLHVYREGTKR
jgi:signal transduction histidine kinase